MYFAFFYVGVIYYIFKFQQILFIFYHLVHLYIKTFDFLFENLINRNRNHQME